MSLPKLPSHLVLRPLEQTDFEKGTIESRELLLIMYRILGMSLDADHHRSTLKSAVHRYLDRYVINSLFIYDQRDSTI